MGSNRKTEVEVVAYSGCFVCGDKNDIGLKLRFLWDGEACRTSFTATEEFCGYHRLLHGGILATILDEVMIKAILAMDIVAVTGEMTVKYLAPVNTDDRIDFEARVLKHRGRLFLTEGSAHNQVGVLVASATAKYIEVAKSDLREQLLSSLDVDNK